MGPSAFGHRAALLRQVFGCRCQILCIPDNNGVHHQRERRGTAELRFIAAVGEAACRAKKRARASPCKPPPYAMERAVGPRGGAVGARPLIAPNGPLAAIG